MLSVIFIAMLMNRILKTILYIITAAALLSSCATGLGYNESGQIAADYRELYKLEEPENINGLFPDQIYIKTRTQTFNSYFEFQLYNGRIYYKDPEGHEPEVWTLLKKTGLPGSLFDSEFTPPESIVEISADSDVLYALSGDGVFYFIRTPGRWLDGGWSWDRDIGFPEKSTLRLPEELNNRRSWALSRRGEEVLWYEDINGNQHHYGTIGIISNYMLSADGQEIRFADPGLPSDFSHNFLGPERGRYIAESMSASASTIFLINSAGEMYSRLVDFDTVGSDPMLFKYTYDGRYTDKRPGTDYGTNFNYWALPAEGWKLEPHIVLEGDAELTDRITIIQNGRGNGARELRVAGLNSSGRPGYYYKQIDERVWDFKAAPLLLEIDDYLDTTLPAERGESPDRSLTGRLWSDGVPVEGVEVRVDGFNLFEGSGTLTASKGDSELKMKFHPVEMWYYFKRNMPGRDGTPKLMMATIELPENWVHGLSGYFNVFDGRAFAFTAEAAEGYLIIESAYAFGAEIKMVLAEDSELQIFNPDTLRLLYMMDRDQLVKEFFDEDLQISGGAGGNPHAKGAYIAAAERNRLYLEKLTAVEDALSGRNLSSNLSDISYGGFESFLSLTGLNRLDYPKFKTVTMYSGVILDYIKSSVQMTIDSRQSMYNYMTGHVEGRIRHYYSLASGRPAEPFFESPAGYLNAAQIDLSGINHDPLMISQGLKLDTDLLEYYPVLTIEDDYGRHGYMLELTDFEDAMTAYLNTLKAGNLSAELKLQGRIMDYINDGGLRTDIECVYSNGVFEIFDESGEVFLSFKTR